MTWLGAVPALAGEHGAAHVDALLLAAFDGVPADFVCTHVDRSGPVAVTTLSAHVPGEVDVDRLAEALGGPVVVLDDSGTPAARAARAGRDRADGRCVRFPGQSALTGTHPAAEVVAVSAIDRVVGIGVEVAPTDPVRTLGFLRPVCRDGELLLLVEPAVGGVLRPAEAESPHECCGGH
ncbi:hypothetical protein ADK67_11205 [Saccharothrix sp. NRRL B-16348]|uniref:hypothetical protein n=1 Tax=Saccharothrix sp. NRRL B-16348 TaxID=1415542 RepID=UPI0006AF7458|nr:hypothetical protein [Saccharothrix sp. NRRL B-16348]KOX28739.1 hypothetical protein ADK67_11205 [Saccharothrix sp. NRRL B-16348]